MANRWRDWSRGLLALIGAVPILGLADGTLGNCFPIAGRPSGAVPAAYQSTAVLAADSIRITFLGHSSFLIESPDGATAITDYNGMIPTPVTPDFVTMNNAHETHYTHVVDPAVKFVLRGWDPDGGMAMHDQKHLDLRVRNIPTNVREFGGTRYNGNSIFVFEVADLCVAHLGHLHHTLTDVHLGELGIIDVLLVPVDGAYTMAQELMVEVIEQIGPAIVIPMHYFNPSTLARFLTLLGDRYERVFSEAPTITLSRQTLPYRKVLVLPGG